MRRVRSELIAHVGGNPTVVQRALIERAAWLSLRLAQLDRKIADGKTFTQIDSNVYLAWSNSLTRTLVNGLGVNAKSSNGSKNSLPSIVAAMNGGGADDG